MFVALGCSLLAHLLLLVWLLPPNFESLPARAPEDKPFEVTTTSEDAPPDDALPEVPVQAQQQESLELAQLPEDLQAPQLVEDEVVEEEAVAEEQREEPEEVVEPPSLDENMKVVQQMTNEEAPEKADFISQQANRVEEETRAEETTALDVLPGETLPEELVEETGADQETSGEDEAPEQDMAALSEATPQLPEQAVAPEVAESPPEPAEQAPVERAQLAQDAPPTPAESPADSPDELAQESMFLREKAPTTAPPRSLFVPDARDYDKLLAEGDKKQAAGMKTPPGGRRLLAGWKDKERAMRASLENMITEVRPGNHTAVNAAASVYADFIARIHRKLHPLWGAGFLPRLDGRYPPGHPLSNPRLEVTLEYIIDADSGVVDAVNIVRTSGEMLFDGEGVVVFHQIGPHTDAPPEIISPDGKVYIHWTLWRDQQQCGPWGATVFIVDKGGRKRVDHAGQRVSDG